MLQGTFRFRLLGNGHDFASTFSDAIGSCMKIGSGGFQSKDKGSKVKGLHIDSQRS